MTKKKEPSPNGQQQESPEKPNADTWIPVLHLTSGVLHGIIASIGKLKAESGGVLGGAEGVEAVTHFYFDESSRRTGVTYSPDYGTVNRLFKDIWNPAGVRLRGFVHSHPGRMDRPSMGDEEYASRILANIEGLERLWLPIVGTFPDREKFVMTPWAACRTADGGLTIARGKIRLLTAEGEAALTDEGQRLVEALGLDRDLDRVVVSRDVLDAPATVAIAWPGKTSPKKKVPYLPALPSVRTPLGDTFNRVSQAYDLELMANCRVIVVGAGGAAQWLEDMARAGLEQFVLVDPDTVSESNLATQQTYRRDIGRPKVDCIAERIRDINPNARCVPLRRSLDDLSDQEVHVLARRDLDGRTTVRTILFGLTDSFPAQARVNRLALKLGLPSLCAQVYAEGRAAEITYTFPGITPACHRCMLSPRYRAYLVDGFENNVTSHGTPIFSTGRLNALKGYLTLAMIHHGSTHPRWGGILMQNGNRNLVQIRMDAHSGLGVFDRVFGGGDRDRIFCDETVWLPQLPECPEHGYEPCPDCGGTGDLWNAMNRFEDTRMMPVPAPRQTEHPDPKTGGPAAPTQKEIQHETVSAQ